MDFSKAKAFDIVDHEILLMKLHHYGLGGEMLDWLGDYLSNRVKCALCDGVSSERMAVKFGVPKNQLIVLFSGFFIRFPNNELTYSRYMPNQ